MPLFGLLEPFLIGWPRLAQLVAFLLLLGVAFLLNYMVHQHQLLAKKSWLPALLVVVLGSCTPDLLQLSPQLIALVFLLPAVHILADTYRMTAAYRQVFNVGVLIALASLVYLPAAVFLVFVFFALVNLRPFIWREWIILLFGFLLPYVYVTAWYYWHDQVAELYSSRILEPVLQRDFFLKLPVFNYGLAGIIGLLLLAAMGRFVAGSGTATLKTKKGVSLMNWLLFFALMSVLPAQHFGAGVFLLTLPSLAFLTANYFLLARRVWLAELLFALLLLAIVLGYKPWLV